MPTRSLSPGLQAVPLGGESWLRSPLEGHVSNLPESDPMLGPMLSSCHC